MQPASKIADEPELEREVDEAIAEHGGDARETVKALLVANAYLEAARDKALNLTSTGFIRGRFEAFGREKG